MKKIIDITGLDCAECASELEEELEEIEGVKNVSVSFVTQKISLEYENEFALEKVIDKANHFEEVKVILRKDAKLKIVGIDCADCAMELEEELKKVTGLENVSVNFVSSLVTFSYIDLSDLAKAKYIINHFEEVKVVEDDKPSENSKLDLYLIIISAIVFLITFVLVRVIPKASLLISYIGYLTSYIIVGYPVLIKTGKSILKGHIFDENFLMTLASIGAILITIFTSQNELQEAAMVMLLYQLGEYLQGVAVGSSRKTIADLVKMKAKEVTKVVDGEEIVVDPVMLDIGDVIKISAGELVGADATLIEGEALMDTKSLTGEALPKSFKAGDELLAGYVNKSNVIYAKVIRNASDSAVAKILDMVENSASKKARPEKFITKFAKFYTPIVCLIALLIAVLAPVIEHFVTGNAYAFAPWIIKALTILVISCPCALIISVPLTYFGGIGAAAKKGILVKGANSLDELRSVKTLLTDKTGTLTEGKFVITDVKSENKELFLDVCHSLEISSKHPIAEAFKGYNGKLTAKDVEEISGKGLVGLIDGKKALVGNYQLLVDNHIETAKINSLSTVIYAVYDNTYLGYCLIDDKAKEGINSFVEKLHHDGISRVVMLTGDLNSRATAFMHEYGLDEVRAELLPADKLEACKEYKKEGKVAYIGDGMNDAPVMVEADCSFSMGTLGSDAAVEASDFVLVGDDLNGVITARNISKKTNTIVVENIVFSILIKVTVMILGAFGIVPLWLAVFSDVGVMLLAVLNSLRIRLFK